MLCFLNKIVIRLCKLSINEIDINKIKVGQKAVISVDAIEDKEYEGEVYRIDEIGISDSGLVYLMYI